MDNLPPYLTFDQAAREILNLLHQRLGFDLWMVTRTKEDDWIVLQAEDQGYGVKSGDVFRWADSFCSRMVLGEGPRIASCSAEVSAYAEAPIAQQVAIGAYVGVPLELRDGSLFGTLCAIHPAPKPESIASELPLIELLSQLLSTILAAKLQTEEQRRWLERAQADATTDVLTGLYNRRGWDQLVHAEECRCQRYGHSACVLSIDLDGLKQVNDTQGHAKGDELIQRAANAIKAAVRQQDIVARVGGDELLVLGIECNTPSAEALLARVDAALKAAGVSASLGVALRAPQESIQEAVAKADKAMYVCKRARRSARCS